MIAICKNKQMNQQSQQQRHLYRQEGGSRTSERNPLQRESNSSRDNQQTPVYIDTEDLIAHRHQLAMRDSHNRYSHQQPYAVQNGLQHNSSRTIFDVLMSGGGTTEEDEEVGFSEYMPPTQEERVDREPSGRSSYQRVQDQLMALNPHTPQSLSVKTQQVKQFSLEEVQNLVLSRCEWLELLKRLCIWGKTKGALKILVQQEAPPLVKRLEAYKEKCLSFGQILGLLDSANEDLGWDDLMEQVMCLRPYTQVRDHALDQIKAQVKKTVLKDNSLLLDLSDIRVPDTCPSLDGLIQGAASIKQAEYTQVKALSLCSVVPSPHNAMRLADTLSRSLVILNVSSLGSQNVEPLLRDQYFPSLQFLNIASNSIEDLTKLVTGTRFPCIKEVIASHNQISSKQRSLLPQTLKLLDLSYNKLEDLLSIATFMAQGSTLLVLDVSGNPFKTPSHLKILQSLLPTLAHVIMHHEGEQSCIGLSCFENFGDLAFKLVPPKYNNLAQMDFLGGCTISPALAQTPSTMIDLRELTNKPTNRVLDFGLQLDLLKQETMQSERIMPNDPPQIRIKNDSKKYFPLHEKVPTVRARPSSSISLHQGPSMQSSQANTARKAKVYTYAYPNHPYQQENQYVTPTTSYQPIKHAQSAQLLDPITQGRQSFNLPLRAEPKHHAESSDCHVTKDGGLLTPSVPDFDVASYYEQKKMTMNLNEVRNMPQKQVYKIDGVATKGSPVKAMMISQPHKQVSAGKQKLQSAVKYTMSGRKENEQPAGLIKLHRVERSKSAMQSTDMLIREGINLLQSMSKTRNKTPRTQEKSLIRRTLPHQSDINSFMGSINEIAGDSPARSKTQISVETKRSGPDRFGFNRSRSQKDGLTDMRDMVLRTQQTSSDMMNLGEPQQKAVRHKEMTFNNNTNASNHNSARQQMPVVVQQHVKMNMRYDPYHPIPHHIQVMRHPTGKQDPFLNEDLLNSNSSNLTTPRFSERGMSLHNYPPNGSREQQYSEAMMLIKAQRLKNERRKTSLNLSKQPRNLKSAQGFSISSSQLKLSGGHQAVIRSSNSNNRSMVQTSQASTAAKSTMKIDLRKLKSNY